MVTRDFRGSGGACASCRGVATRLFATLLSASALAVAAACGSSTTTNVTAPSTTRCQPTISTPTATFPSAGGTGTATVGVSRECEWSASSNASWIAITAGSRGQGDGTITYRVDANADPVTRRGALSVGGSEAELSQDAAPCRYDVSAPAMPVSSDGGATAIAVRTHQACSWTAASADGWAGASPAAGKGDAAVQLTVAPNDGAPRTTILTIAGQRITVTQLERSVPAPAPAPMPSPAPPPGPSPSPAPPPAPSPAPLPAPSPAPSPAPPPAPAPGPVPVSAIELRGTIDSVSGSCPALTFALRGRTVFTTSSTEFKKMPCKDVRADAELKVTGYLMSDGTVRADKVEKDS